MISFAALAWSFSCCCRPSSCSEDPLPRQERSSCWAAPGWSRIVGGLGFFWGSSGKGKFQRRGRWRGARGRRARSTCEVFARNLRSECSAEAWSSISGGASTFHRFRSPFQSRSEDRRRTSWLGTLGRFRCDFRESGKDRTTNTLRARWEGSSWWQL